MDEVNETMQILKFMTGLWWRILSGSLWFEAFCGLVKSFMTSTGEELRWLVAAAVVFGWNRVNLKVIGIEQRKTEEIRRI
jgi:hypothetical protein